MADAVDLRLLHPFNWVALTSQPSLSDRQTFSHLRAIVAIVLLVGVYDLRSLLKLVNTTILEIVIGMLPTRGVLVLKNGSTRGRVLWKR